MHSAAAALSRGKSPFSREVRQPPRRASSLAQPALPTQTTNRCSPSLYPLLPGLASVPKQPGEGEPTSRLGPKPGSCAPTRRSVLCLLPGVRATHTLARRPGVRRINAATQAERTGPQPRSARAGAAPRRARPWAPKLRGAYKRGRGEWGSGDGFPSRQNEKTLSKCHQPGLNRPFPAAARSQFIYLFIWGAVLALSFPFQAHVSALRRKMQ